MATNACLPSHCRVQVSRNLADLASVWPGFAEASGHALLAFQHREVLEVWRDTIGLARQVDPLFVRVDSPHGTPLMLLPLAIERGGGVRQLAFMDGGVADYNAPVLGGAATSIDATAMRQLWHSIVAVVPAFDVVRFTKMPATVAGVPNPLVLLGATPDRHSAYLTDLTASPSAAPSGKPFKGISMSRDSERQRRRLAEIGKLTFKIAETDGERRQLLDVMMRYKRRRYLETRGVDSFARPGYPAYYQEMTNRLGGSGAVHLSALVLDGTPLAVHWGIATPRRYYYLMPAYAGGEWPKYSPGSLLMEHLIDWCRRQGMTTFDLGVGDEPYKLKIAHETVPLFALSQACTMAGRAYLAAQGLRHRLSEGALGDRWRSLKLKLGRGGSGGT